MPETLPKPAYVERYVPLTYELRSNCYAFVEAYLGVNLDRMDALVGSTTLPLKEGNVALFLYRKPTHVLRHVAIIVKIEENGFWVVETNYGVHDRQRRFVKNEDLALLGTFDPQLQLHRE